jgi:WD40 repeat-containing protein SMU1
MEIDSTEVLRLILQFLNENGLSRSVGVLQEESGVSLNMLERPEGFVADVYAGRWDAVLPVLSTLRLPPRVLQALYEQIVRELVDANEVDAARAVLRGVLPLVLLRGEDGEAYARLEALVARGGGGGGSGGGAGVGAAHAAARAAIARSILEHADTAPPSRLLMLLGQALKWQAHTASLCGGGGGATLLGVGSSSSGGGARRGERPDESEPARGAPGPAALSYPDAGARPTAAHVTGDGASFVVGGGDGLLEVFSPATGKLRLDLGFQARDEFMLHEAAVTCIASSADGELLCSGAADGRVKVWRLLTGECVRRLLDTHGGGAVCALAFSRDGGSVVTGGGDGVARLWGLRSGKCLREFRGHAAHVSSVALMGEGEGGAAHTLLTGGADGRVALWDVGTGERVSWLAPPPPPAGGEPSVLSALPAPGEDGGVLVLPRGGSIYWLAPGGALVRSFSIGEGAGDAAPAQRQGAAAQAPGAAPQELVAMALSPTGKWLYGGTDGGCVWAWEAATGAVAHRALPSQRAHRGAVVGLAAHPWRALLFSWGTEGDVKSWLP